MKNKIKVIGIISLFLLTGLTTISAAEINITIKNIIYVDDDNTQGPWDGSQEHPYQFIQDAIDAAENGDTVFVKSGHYVESIGINKSIVMIGEDKENTIISVHYEYIYVTAEMVTLFNFTILADGIGIMIESNNNTISEINFNGTYHYALDFISSNNNTIISNAFTSYGQKGIALWNSNNNLIIDNDFNECNGGIYFKQSCYNNIDNNRFIGTDWGGAIYIYYECEFNTIIENYIENWNYNGGGIELIDANNSLIKDNIICKCNWGTWTDGPIQLWRADNNIVQNNTMFDNQAAGVSIYDSDKNLVYYNNIYDNYVGIWFMGKGAAENEIKFNNISSSQGEGIRVTDLQGCCNNNFIWYNNLRENHINAADCCNNYWYNETLEIGNYYDDNIWSDLDGDGITDNPYVIQSGSNKDYYPLAVPWGIDDNEQPFKPDTPSGTTSGTIRNKYFYSTSTIDPDGDQLYYLFNWDDGTTSGWIGPFNSGTIALASKTWTYKGTYLVKVIARDTHVKLSSWSDPLSVTMPRIKEINRLFPNFQQNYPYMLSIIQNLLKRLVI
jgi:parallel beta-helix repeat protein